MSGKVEEKIVDYEEMAEQAEMEAAADEVAGGAASAGEEADGNADTEAAEEDDNYIVEFQNEYEYMSGLEVKKIKSVDLSGLLELTCTDGEILDRILIKLNHRPQNRFTDTTYCKHVAAKVTGLPLEFFNTLKIRDMMLIVARINYFFLFG